MGKTAAVDTGPAPARMDYPYRWLKHMILCRCGLVERAGSGPSAIHAFKFRRPVFRSRRWKAEVRELVTRDHIDEHLEIPNDATTSGVRAEENVRIADYQHNGGSTPAGLPPVGMRRTAGTG